MGGPEAFRAEAKRSLRSEPGRSHLGSPLRFEVEVGGQRIERGRVHVDAVAPACRLQRRPQATPLGLGPLPITDGYVVAEVVRLGAELVTSSPVIR